MSCPFLFQFYGHSFFPSLFIISPFIGLASVFVVHFPLFSQIIKSYVGFPFINTSSDMLVSECLLLYPLKICALSLFIDLQCVGEGVEIKRGCVWVWEQVWGWGWGCEFTCPNRLVFYYLYHDNPNSRIFLTHATSFDRAVHSSSPRFVWGL